MSGTWLESREHLSYDYVSCKLGIQPGLVGARDPAPKLLCAVSLSLLGEAPTAQGLSQMQVDFLDLTVPQGGHVAPVE